MNRNLRFWIELIFPDDQMDVHWAYSAERNSNVWCVWTKALLATTSSRPTPYRYSRPNASSTSRQCENGRICPKTPSLPGNSTRYPQMIGWPKPLFWRICFGINRRRSPGWTVSLLKESGCRSSFSYRHRRVNPQKCAASPPGGRDQVWASGFPVRSGVGEVMDRVASLIRRTDGGKVHNSKNIRVFKD